MKALSGATLIGLVLAAAAFAQPPEDSPTGSPVRLPMPTLPSSLRSVPDAPGAQFPGLGVPMPTVPTLPKPQPGDEAKWTPPSPSALNAPYVQNPIFDLPTPDSELSSGPIEAGRAHSGIRLWLTADYLFWWVKRAPQPNSLVVTGPVTDAFPGALDQPNTQVLFGGKGFGFNPFSGARLSGGLWGGPDNRIGLEIGGFILEQKSEKFSAAGDALGQPFIARPFINARTGFENVYFVSQNFADPDRTALMTGGMDISATSRLWGWEINGLFNAARGEILAANLIGGIRSVGLRERLHFNETLRNLAPGGAVFFGGTSVDPLNVVTTFDRFDAENTFYGGQLGARVHLEQGQFGLDVTAKGALGVTQQLVVVDGGSYLVDGTVGKVATGLPGGVLAQTSNMGRHFRNAFGVIPEVNIDLSCAITENVILKLGYTFMYWNRVARPGNQIDRTINPGLVPTDADFGTAGGTARPSFPFNTTSFWAQGANLGLEVRY
jgi:hypothetical protein